MWKAPGSIPSAEGGREGMDGEGQGQGRGKMLVLGKVERVQFDCSTRSIQSTNENEEEGVIWFRVWIWRFGQLGYTARTKVWVAHHRAKPS